jgi:hypothetical protein
MNSPRPHRRFPHAPFAAIVVAAAYVPALWAFFLHDDWMHLSQTWRFEQLSLAQIWLAPHEWFYRPIFHSTFGLMSLAFGPRPILWHAVAIALHVTNVLLLLALLRRTGVGPVAATIGAIAFGLYPRSPEAVAWLSAMSGVLAGLFGLLAAHVALTTRLSPLPRALLCSLCWALALLSKEEAVGLIIVLPLAPVLLGYFKQKAELAEWAGGCLSLVLVLLGFLVMESRGEVAYGSIAPEPSMALLRTIVYAPLWVMGNPMTRELFRPIWVWPLLGLAGAALWRGHPRLRLGLLWTFATAVPITLVLGAAAMQPRLAYIPSVGMAILLAVIVDRVVSRREPIGALTWTTLAVFLLACLHMGIHELRIGGGVALAACLWLAPIAPRRSPSAVGCLAAAALAYRSLELLAPYANLVLALPPAVTMGMPFGAVGALWLMGRWRGSMLAPGETLAEALLCACAIFWTSVPGAATLLLVVLVAQIVRARAGWPNGEALALRYGAPVVAALIAASWLAATYPTNRFWMQTGLDARATTLAVVPILQGLPPGASVDVVSSPAAPMAADNHVQLDVVARVFADRPDLRVGTPHSRGAAMKKADAPPPPGEYQLVWTDDGAPHLRRR